MNTYYYYTYIDDDGETGSGVIEYNGDNCEFNLQDQHDHLWDDQGIPCTITFFHKISEQNYKQYCKHIDRVNNYYDNKKDVKETILKVINNEGQKQDTKG